MTRDPTLVGPVRVEGSVVGWVLAVYPEAGEAGGSFRYAPRKPTARCVGPAVDPARARAEAARRARAKVRRYCASNRLNRFATLTYRGEGCHDQVALRSHVAQFFRQLRSGLGGKALPYVWTPEWHKTDHGLHVHFAVGRYVRRSIIERAWGRGFVHIKLLGDLPVGSGAWEEARRAAGYLSKYVGKAFDDERIAGRHRYDVAQRFQPNAVQVWGRTEQEAVQAACEQFGGRLPVRAWSSASVEGWEAPPALWLQWA
jgi:hypothetical protein